MDTDGFLETDPTEPWTALERKRGLILPLALQKAPGKGNLKCIALRKLNCIQNPFTEITYTDTFIFHLKRNSSTPSGFYVK